MLELDSTMNDVELSAEAIEFAKRHKKDIAIEVTSVDTYPSERHPVSIFMAGSPGAGKTEYSRELIKMLSDGTRPPPIRIDGDDLRSRFPKYNGKNSALFQSAASILVERIHDLALDKKQSFVLDGTFSRIGKASDNVRRSVVKKRPVFIFYVYEEPKAAWGFTKAREKEEGRNIPKEAFIEEFIGARETVIKIKRDFGESVMVYLVRKDLASKTGAPGFVVRLTSADKTIDDYVKSRYTKEQLTSLL